MQAWEVRVARGLNRVLGRRGSVFADRYHGEVIQSPRQTRAVLCYVMLNARRHDEHLDRRWHGVDPFSSAWWFDGWRDYAWQRGLSPPSERPVAPAGSWLLTVGWRRHGLLAIDEVPAARRREEARRARSCVDKSGASVEIEALERSVRDAFCSGWRRRTVAGGDDRGCDRGALVPES